ncbi:hypothetical protein KJ641_04040 [Patescibacteria group bacterium]|nr:hypothetical protein [Patescibacteria group bacterium]MBU1896010.1 hypothetical protein [Patescibacteria group bacterium]
MPEQMTHRPKGLDQPSIDTDVNDLDKIAKEQDIIDANRSKGRATELASQISDYKKDEATRNTAKKQTAETEGAIQTAIAEKKATKAAQKKTNQQRIKKKIAPLLAQEKERIATANKTKKEERGKAEATKKRIVELQASLSEPEKQPAKPTPEELTQKFAKENPNYVEFLRERRKQEKQKGAEATRPAPHEAPSETIKVDEDYLSEVEMARSSGFADDYEEQPVAGYVGNTTQQRKWLQAGENPPAEEDYTASESKEYREALNKATEKWNELKKIQQEIKKRIKITGFFAPKIKFLGELPDECDFSLDGLNMKNGEKVQSWLEKKGRKIEAKIIDEYLIKIAGYERAIGESYSTSAKGKESLGRAKTRGASTKAGATKKGPFTA